MRKLLSFLIVLLSFTAANSQSYQEIKANRVLVLQTLRPSRDTLPQAVADSGTISWKNGQYYKWTGYKWDPVVNLQNASSLGFKILYFDGTAHRIKPLIPNTGTFIVMDSTATTIGVSMDTTALKNWIAARFPGGGGGSGAVYLQMLGVSGIALNTSVNDSTIGSRYIRDSSGIGVSLAPNGAIVVRNKWNILDSLQDVAVSGASSGQALIYNGTNWVNQTIVTGGTITTVGLAVPTGMTQNGPLTGSGGTITITMPVTGILYGTGSGFGSTTITTPLTFSGGVLSMPPASGSANGYLLSTDHTIFSNKVNTVSNIGTGVGIYSAKVGTDIQLRSITGTGGISISLSGNNVNIDGGGGGGGGQDVYILDGQEGQPGSQIWWQNDSVLRIKTFKALNSFTSIASASDTTINIGMDTSVAGPWVRAFIPTGAKLVNPAGGGAYLLRQIAIDTLTVKYFDTSRYIKYDTAQAYVRPRLDTAAMRADGLLSASGSIPPLSTLPDVQITTPDDDDILVYDGTLSKWVNEPKTPLDVIRGTSGSDVDSIYLFDGVNRSSPGAYSPIGVVDGYNGLTKSGVNIGIGGTLSTTTEIQLGTNNLEIRKDTSANSPSEFGLHFNNEVVATSGNQKASPSARFTANGWKTNATPSSQPIDVRMYAEAIQGAVGPTAQFNIERRTNNGSWQTWFQLMNEGLKIIGTGGSGYGGISMDGTVPIAQTIHSGTFIDFRVTGAPAATTFNFVQPDQSASSGTLITQRISGSTLGFTSSGSASYTALSVEPIINYSGSGIARGIHILPTLTAATDFRPFEISTGRAVLKGVVVGHAIAPNSADYTVGQNDLIVELSDLSGANRNVVLPSTGIAGRILKIYNLSSDATFKWSFSGGTATDINGASVTTLTDVTVYNLSWNGTTWRVE